MGTAGCSLLPQDVQARLTVRPRDQPDRSPCLPAVAGIILPTMAFVNPLLARWAAGRPTYGGWLSTSEALIADFLAAAGFDEICADQQHGSIDLHTIGPLFATLTSHGVWPTTRVASNDPMAIGKSLDMGALGVIVPMVSTAEEAAALVAACRYPPRGIRSIGPTRALYTIGLALGG